MKPLALSRFGAVSVLALAACSLPQAQVPIRDGPDATIGCYLLSHEPWSSNAIFPSDSTAQRVPPAAIQLLISRGIIPGIALMGPGFGALAGRWYLRADTLVIRWTDDANGVELRLVADSGALVGTGRAWASHAAGIPNPTTRVRALKQQC